MTKILKSQPGRQLISCLLPKGDHSRGSEGKNVLVLAVSGTVSEPSQPSYSSHLYCEDQEAKISNLIMLISNTEVLDNI